MHLPNVSDTLGFFVKGGQLSHFTPNAITVKSTDSLCILALRWQEGWTTGDDATIVNYKGLLAVKSVIGKGICISYHNPAFSIGLNYSLLVLLLFLLCLYPFSFLQIAAEAVSIG